MEERVPKRERLLSLVFPAHCVLCGKLTEGGRRLCPECSRNPAPESVYRKLGNRYESHSLLCVAACSYAGEAKQLVLGMKLGGKIKNARILADKLLLALPKEWQYADVICWVPVSPQRKKERGYDQSELIARRIGRKTGCPCRPLLRKVRENRVQHELSAEERWVNVLGVYQADQKKICGKRVLLIDGDFRKPAQWRIFDEQKAGRPSFSDFILGDDGARRAMVLNGRSGIYELFQYEALRDPMTVLNSGRLADAMEGLAKQFDYVFVDCSPVAAAADAELWMRQVDTVVMVVRQDVADVRVINDTVDVVWKSAKDFSGFVLNAFQGERLLAGRYGYGSY